MTMNSKNPEGAISPNGIHIGHEGEGPFHRRWIPNPPHQLINEVIPFIPNDRNHTFMPFAQSIQIQPKQQEIR